MNKRMKLFASSIKKFFSAHQKRVRKLRLETENEYTQVNLEVTGQVPPWLKGALVRNCAVPVYDLERGKNHLFDGVAMLHSFAIHNGRISYSSRYVKSEAYLAILQSDTEFYQCTIDAKKAKGIQDAGVNVFKYNQDFVALTEAPLPVRFDLTTMDTLGSFEFRDALPKKNIFESAHPHYCADSGDIYNFLIEYKKTSTYVLYKMSKGSSSREVIARIPVKKPGYMHSFAMTKNYLVLVEYPLVINPLRLLFAKIDSFASYIRLFDWLPEQPTRFLIVDKRSGNLVSEIKTQALFSFHHANAYEQDDEIIVDLMAHNFAKLGQLLPQAKTSGATMQGLTRFRLNVADHRCTHEVILERLLDFPKISDALDGKKYRYLYMIDSEPNNHSLIKYDWQRNKEVSWQAPNTTIIEPVFVLSPHARSEDDGILVTVVSDTITNRSSLLIIDATNLHELARAELPEHMPNSFHGQFFIV